MPGLETELRVEGIELLADAYANSPERVYAAAERAGQQAVSAYGESIGVETPYVSGFLFRSESTRLEDAFTIVFRAGAFYASFVLRHNPFIDRGIERVQARVDAIYEAEFDRLAETFFEGR